MTSRLYEPLTWLPRSLPVADLALLKRPLAYASHVGCQDIHKLRYCQQRHVNAHQSPLKASRVMLNGSKWKNRTLLLAWLPMSPPPTEDLAWLNAPLACWKDCATTFRSQLSSPSLGRADISFQALLRGMAAEVLQQRHHDIQAGRASHLAAEVIASRRLGLVKEALGLYTQIRC